MSNLKLITIPGHDKTLHQIIHGFFRRKDSTCKVILETGKLFEINIKYGKKLPFSAAGSEVFFRELKNIFGELQLPGKITLYPKGGGVKAQVISALKGIGAVVRYMYPSISEQVKRHPILMTDLRIHEENKPGFDGARAKKTFVKR